MSDENLTIGKHLRRPSYRQSTFLRIFFKSCNSPCLDFLQSEILVAHAAIKALFTKKYKIWQQTLNSNSKQAFGYPLWPLCWYDPDNLRSGLFGKRLHKAEQWISLSCVQGNSSRPKWQKRPEWRRRRKLPSDHKVLLLLNLYLL